MANRSTLFRLLLETLPAATLSRALSTLAEQRLPPPLQRRVNTSFARLAKIDVDEAEQTPEHYPSLNAFFTRRLRDGVRPLCAESEQLVAPVDGRLRDFGPVDDGQLLQAKGRTYSLRALLDEDPLCARFERASAACFYLSPRDYHRIHAPCDARIAAIRHVPGALFPVNALGIEHIENLFPRNERLIFFLERDDGHWVAVVNVGATCVGRLSTPFATVPPCHRELASQRLAVGEQQRVVRGEEIAVFNLGSTTILVFDDPAFDFANELRPEQRTRVGQRIGAFPGA